MNNVIYALIESTDCAGTTDRWEEEIAHAEDLSDAFSDHAKYDAKYAEGVRKITISPRFIVERRDAETVVLTIEGKKHIIPLAIARALAVATGNVTEGDR